MVSSGPFGEGHQLFVSHTKILPPRIDALSDSFANFLGKFENIVNITANLEKGHYDEGDTATNLCLKKNQDQETFYISQENYDYKSLRFGNLTVYRFRLECQCGGLSHSETCSDFLPMDKQGWGGYMGTLGNSYFIPRH